jgi:PhnB protein
METQVTPIPPGYHALSPYLTVEDGARAIDFYTRAFGARKHGHLEGPGGAVVHAELQVGDSRFMLGEEFPRKGTTAKTAADTAAALFLYVENVNEVFSRALENGARELEPVRDQFWGDRTGTLLDPFGHKWIIGTHVEDVPLEEIRRRQAKLFS